ncbi:MAG: EamA family transporter RarD [Corynebacterium sp.]|nr:EamA family transporter RarD [Corynebacterium sp.]
MGYGILTYVMWGLFPAYFPLLEPASAVEIIAHRVMWTAVFVAGLVTSQRGWAKVARLFAEHGWRLGVAGLLIGCNWLVYVFAVNSGHVSDAALGYFINPLVSIVLGMVFFQERLRKFQVLAVTIAALAVLWLAFSQPTLPLIPLALALSFGFYGVIKKGLHVAPTISLMAETLVLLPLALGYIAWLQTQERNTFVQEDIGHSVMLITTGLVTALPLLTFALAAQRIPLGALGMLQYITPTIQFIWALFIVHEEVTASRWIGFIAIWIAVALYLIDLLRHRVPRRSRGLHSPD